MAGMSNSEEEGAKIILRHSIDLHSVHNSKLNISEILLEKQWSGQVLSLITKSEP